MFENFITCQMTVISLFLHFFVVPQTESPVINILLASFISSICDPCAWVINWWEKNSVCNLQYRPKTLLVRLMSRQHGWKLPSNSWTLIYTLRHSFNSIQFLHCSWEHQWPCDAGTVCGHSWLQETKQKWGQHGGRRYCGGYRQEWKW